VHCVRSYNLLVERGNSWTNRRHHDQSQIFQHSKSAQQSGLLGKHYELCVYYKSQFRPMICLQQIAFHMISVSSFFFSDTLKFGPSMLSIIILCNDKPLLYNVFMILSFRFNCWLNDSAGFASSHRSQFSIYRKYRTLYTYIGHNWTFLRNIGFVGHLGPLRGEHKRRRKWDCCALCHLL